MKRLRYLAAAVALGLNFGASLAHADDGPATLPFREDVGNLPSVQRGARDFMNYCSGCHSMKYLRYNRLGKDIGISDDLLKTNLMFNSDKVGETIKTSMPATAKDWFGQQPPDLTLETKARGSDWVYSYLLSFYLDDTRPLGVNNLYLPGVSMPDVLGELQGWQKKVEPPKDGKSGASSAMSEDHGPKLEIVQAGSLSPEEYRAFVTDLTNFMAYAAEPGKTDRISTGFKVMMYLFVLLVLTYLLKKEFWRDVQH